jgi:hypothetical protein
MAFVVVPKAGRVVEDGAMTTASELSRAREDVTTHESDGEIGCLHLHLHPHTVRSLGPPFAHCSNHANHLTI